MLVLNTKNGKCFRESIYIDGRQVFSPRFTRKTDAKAWKAKKIVERDEYKATGKRPEKRRSFTVDGFKDYSTNWLNNRVKVRNSNKTYLHYESIVRVHLLPLLDNRPLDEITTNDADKLTGKLMDRGHNAKGINIIVSILKMILVEAMKDGDIEKNPLLYYKRLKTYARPDVYLTKEEIKKFLEVNIHNYLYPLFVLALNTGLRRGELCGLCWDMVNFDNGLISIARHRDRYGLVDRLKTQGSKRFIPMNNQVLKLLKRLKKSATNEYVLVNHQGKPIPVHHIYRSFKDALNRAGIDRAIRFHDIRHTYASHFMMNDGNIYALQKILGHTSIAMTQRYAHLAPNHLIEASNVVSFG